MLRTPRRVLLAGALALFATAAPAPAAAQRSPVDQAHPEVKSLVFEGIDNVDESELERNIATSESECINLLAQIFFCWFSHAPAFYEREYLDRDELSADILRIRVFYYKRGWRNAAVDTSVTPNGDGVTVTFHVDEGEPTRVNTVRVLYDSTVMDARRVARLVSIRAGDPLSLLSVDTARVLLLEELWERGYPDARVDTTIVADTARRLADLTYRAIPGERATVGTITIRGTDQVDPQTIVNAMTLQTGEIFRRSDVLVSQRNLYESNLFRTALVTVPPQADTVKDVEVTVLEAPQREVRVAGGFNTIDYFQVEGRLTHYNLLGGARRLDASAALSNLLAAQINGAGIFRTYDVDPAYLEPTYQLSLDFRQPSFLERPENSFSIGAFMNRRSAPGVYIERNYGGLATLTRTLAMREQATASYRYEVTRIQASDVYFCVNYGVCDTTTITTLRSRQSLTPLGISYVRDKSNEPFTPTAGYVMRGDVEHASRLTGSDYGYNRISGDAAYYFRVGRSRAKGWASSSVSPAVTNTVLATHLRLGIVRPIGGNNDPTSVLHPRKRFYAGGAQSVRGYAENQLGPRVLTVAPERLEFAQSTPGGTCNYRTTDVQFCDPNSLNLATPDADDRLIEDAAFFPRPLGGTSVIEGSVELRFPIWKKLTGAAFIDAAAVGEASVASFSDLVDIDLLTNGTWAVTPGIGARYHTRVGPIRVDLGYNPNKAEQLPVYTEVMIGGRREIVALNAARIYQPHTNWYDRLTLHLSIGQAY